MTDWMIAVLGLTCGAAWGALLAWQMTARHMTRRFLETIDSVNDGDNLIRDALFSQVHAAMTGERSRAYSPTNDTPVVPRPWAGDGPAGSTRKDTPA